MADPQSLTVGDHVLVRAVVDDVFALEYDQPPPAGSPTHAVRLAFQDGERASVWPAEIVQADPLRMPQLPVDDDRALRIGVVAGLLARELPRGGNGFHPSHVEVLDDDAGRHLDTVRVHAPSGTFLVAVIRETRR